MKINTCYVVLKTDKSIDEEVNKFRGYIGNKFKEHPLLHNHYGEGEFLYSYPLIQYKIFNGQPAILGIEEGADLLKKISSELKELKLSKFYRIKEKIIHEKEYEVQPSTDEHHYQFISPWLGLNSKNFEIYSQLKDWKEKKLFLNKTLVGNILSMSKGLGIIVNKRLYVKSHFEPVRVKFKSIYMNGFTGEFKVHYKIPDYFGFGKGVSQGFGAIKEISEE